MELCISSCTVEADIGILCAAAFPVPSSDCDAATAAAAAAAFDTAFHSGPRTTAGVVAASTAAQEVLDNAGRATDTFVDIPERDGDYALLWSFMDPDIRENVNRLFGEGGGGEESSKTCPLTLLAPSSCVSE